MRSCHNNAQYQAVVTFVPTTTSRNWKYESILIIAIEQEIPNSRNFLETLASSKQNFARAEIFVNTKQIWFYLSKSEMSCELFRNRFSS